MARLEAIAKGLFYPTPDRVVDMIADAVEFTTEPSGRLLDTCAGEGVAARLARRWGLESYGVELHAGRAAICSRVMTRALHGSYHQLATTTGAFSVLFLNPPYDDGENGRQEVEFLRAAKQYLVPGGLLVFIPPTRILGSSWLNDTLRNEFTSVEVFEFPEPEFQAFKQVVVFAKKRAADAHSYSWSYGHGIPSGPYGVLGESKYAAGVLPGKGSGSFVFALHGMDPNEVAPRDGGCYRLPQWRTLIGKEDLCSFERPLVAPRPGHIAMLLAAGSLNGTEIDSGEIVKGSSEKVTVTVQDEEAELAFERERIVSRLSVLDLKSGAIRSWRTDEAPDDTREWFAKHGTTLADAVRADHTPIYDGALEGISFDSVQAPGVFEGDLKPRILDAQKRAAVAIVRAWKKRKSAVVSGEMGVGKTAVSVVAAVLAGHKKVIVICPTHLVKKWVREVDTITKTKGAARTVTKLADVDAFFADPSARFLIVSKERAKLGARWAPAFVPRRMRVTEEAIDYEATAELRRQQYYSSFSTPPVMKTVTRIDRVRCCPACGKPIRNEEGTYANLEWLEKTKRACKACESPLWQAQPISARGTTRWPVAKYINQRFSGRYTLIVDEVHQYASPSSDQSRAVQLLCTGASRLLAMTGTLYGGRASSIFHLLYKVDPQFRSIYEYTDSPRFVHDHGLFETAYDLEEYTSRYGTRRNNSGGRVREIPGVNPAMLNLILGYTVFLKLADLGHKMPPFTETVELLDHDPEVRSSARRLAEEVKTVLRDYPKILGQYLMACLGYPDCPEHEQRIVAKGEFGYGEVEVASARAFALSMWPKDRRVIEIAKRERSKGRKTLVFFTQTGRRSPIPRVKAHLESAGLKVAVLDGSIAPDKREEWLQQKAGEFDVLLTNGRLVETGLDLLFATTIVQYSTEYSIPTLRQSTRRSWRLGQTRGVHVIYLAYRGTMQEVALALIARKMRAAELVDGNDIGGLAQHDEAGHDFMLELAREAASR